MEQNPSDAPLQDLARQLGAMAVASHHTLVTAESCTGGWIAKVLTDIAGSSAWFECGIAAYSYESKQALLGVRPETLEQHGAVSRETVLEMVSGALVHSGATLAVAVTGIAGPSGGTRPGAGSTRASPRHRRATSGRASRPRRTGSRTSIRGTIARASSMVSSC